jgi:plastocyanin
MPIQEEIVKKNRWVIIITGIIAALLLLSGCGPKSITLRVEMNEFEFSPNSLSAPAGAPVTLILKNTGTLEHEFAIMKKGSEASVPFGKEDEAQIFWEIELPAKETTTVQFTAPGEPGTYEIVCGTAGHLEQGMKATLVVTE